jgi:hypothetical protein
MAVAHKVIEGLPAGQSAVVHDAVNRAFLDGLQVGTLVCAGIALGAAIVVAWLLPARVGQATPSPASTALTTA